jgi:hypothetical protein
VNFFFRFYYLVKLTVINFTMTSYSDDTKFFIAILETITQFDKATYDETMSSIVTALGGIFTDYDISGMKNVLPLDIWNRQQENMLAAGGNRPKPPIPAPGIPAGPEPIEPIPPVTQAEMNLANMQLTYYNARATACAKANRELQRYHASQSSFKMALLNRTLAIGDTTTHTIITNNRVTNVPDNTISLEDVMLNFTEHFSIPNEAAKDMWQSTFEKQRTLDKPFKEFISTWTVARTKLNATDRVCTDYDLMLKFTAATAHDPRVREFMVELRRTYPGTQTWAQMMALATIQDANLDGDIKLVQSAMATTTTTPTTAGGGGATVATKTGGGATSAARTYCFIHGSFPQSKGHNSDVCKMIKLHAKAYPYDLSKTETFTTNAQVDQAKLAKSPKFEVAGIGKGNAK